MTGSTLNAQANDELLHLKNEFIDIGIKRESGGGIAWFSQVTSQSQSKSPSPSQNFVNAYDRGRLIQQSYYGSEDGSLWNKKPWRWNPVQGGDWKGNGAQVLELKETKDQLYVKTLPKHWASGEDITTATMEQWITLEQQVASIRYKFTQSQGKDHPKRHQELPAVFIDPHYPNLVLYSGNQPWQDQPLERTQRAGPMRIAR